MLLRTQLIVGHFQSSLTLLVPQQLNGLSSMDERVGRRYIVATAFRDNCFFSSVDNDDGVESLCGSTDRASKKLKDTHSTLLYSMSFHEVRFIFKIPLWFA